MADEPELTPDEHLRADVLSICSALGAMEEYQDDNGEISTKYSMGDECLACMKDIRRLIRNDSENSENQVLHLLGEFNIMNSDLIPIVLYNSELDSDVSERLVLACLELFVPMTWPLADGVDDCEEMDNNVLNLHMKYKLSLMTPGVLEAALEVILKPLSIPFKERAQRDHVVIRLVLTLLRNIAAIPDLNTSQSSSESAVEMASMQEKYIKRLQDSKMLELIVTIASSSSHPDYAEWNVIVTQIIFYLLKGSDPKTIAATSSKDEQSQNTMISDRLAEMLQQENKKRVTSRQVAPTRHNRFGGSYSVQSIDGEKYNIHQQTGGIVDLASIMDKNKREYRVGKKKKLQDKLSRPTPYRTLAARNILYDFATSLLESAFNALHSSLLKDIERESKHVLEPDHHKLYYFVGWMLQFRSHLHSKWRADVQKHKEKDGEQLRLPNAADSESNDNMPEHPANFDLVASTMDIRFFLLCIRRMRQSLDEKRWLDVQACAECFKQMLLTLGAMAESDDKDFADVADYVQSNIYYEQSTLDLFVEMIRGYKFQSMGYLQALVELIHQMLRMLEKFASQKKHMFVRKSKKTRKPKENKDKHEGEDNHSQGENSEEEETYEEARERKQAYREHQFKFESFESRFASDEVVRIYCVLLEDFQNLPTSTLSAITNFFHRLMVKRQLEHLFFKLPVLELFNRILPAAKVPQHNPAYLQLAKFIRFCVKQYVKHAQNNPLFLVESLFKGIRQSAIEASANGDKGNDNDDEPVTRLRDHDDTDDDEQDDAVTSYPTTVELEVKPGLTWSQQVGVAIAVIVADKREFLIDWVIEQMLFVIGKRSLEDNMPTEKDADGNDVVKAYENYDMEPSMVAVKSAIRKNAKLRLLLTLLQFEKTEDDYMDTTWTIPASIPSEMLQTNIDMMKEFVANPLAPNGKPAKDMLKKKSKRKRARKDLEKDDDSSQNKRAKKASCPEYHTQQFVLDSDEDDDELFFATELKLRQQNMAAYLAQQYKGLGDANNTPRDSASPLGSQISDRNTTLATNALSGMATSLDDSEGVESMDEDVPLFTSGRIMFQSKPQNNNVSEPANPFDTQDDDLVINEVQSPPSRTAHKTIIFSDDDDIEDDIADTVPQLQIQRRNHRAILSDSDDDDL